MVPSLPKLNELCQKPNYKTVGNWMVRHIERPAALYVTWVLLHTPVTAHQVTVGCMLSAVWGGFLLAAGTAESFLAGSLVWQLWYLLDHVDGQIARYRGTSSNEGLFFDYLMHHVATFAFLFGAAWGLYEASGEVLALFWGYLAAVSVAMIGILNDCQSKTVFTALMKRPGTFRVNPDPLKAVGKMPPGLSLPRRIFSLVHKSCEGHVVMNLFTVFAFLYLSMESSDTEAVLNIFWVILIYLACASTLVWVSKACHTIAKGRITEELARAFPEA